MKILHIIPNLRKGGAERLVTDIVRELNTRVNMQVRLLIFHNLVEYSISDIHHSVKAIPSNIQLSVWKKNISNTAELQQCINDFEPNIIHSHLFESEVVSRSCLFPKALWFSHFHDNMVQFENFSLKTVFNKTKLTNYFEKRILFKNYKKNGGNTFIAISLDSLRYAKETCENYPVIHLPNAINFDKFYAPIRNEIKKIKIVNVGSFVTNKNQRFLVDIGKELEKRNIVFEIHFLGDGQMFKTITSFVDSETLSDKIFFHGNIDCVENYLKEANIYVHSSIKEAFGLVLLEAMAAGLPVVSLDGGGNKDLIEHGKNGFIFDEQDATVFADTIIQLVREKELYTQIAMNGQNFAKNYDIKTYVDKLLDIYQS